ncbi:hypothetical protein AGLY_011452 [Aphis glycines]|uniref:THAP-type domain-containing protein n=1 Tax=Aphis glycines TaxID=307491 RepID=A0A6G0TCH1_APHGL|nr:hypothetical protein AGLY_011452 [Aphis glycines]
MPYKCCACGCNNRDGLAKNIKLFRFLDDDCRKKEWLELVQRENFTVTKSSRLCSAHFRSSEFVEASGKLILKNNARPSIFNFPTTPIKKDGRKKLIGTVLFSSSNNTDHSYSRPSTSFINPSLNNIANSSILVTDSNTVSESIEPYDLTFRPIYHILLNTYLHLKINERERYLNLHKKELKKKDLIRNRKVEPTARRYSDAIKKFDTTIYFYSPKAYSYISLPNPSAIRNWISNIDANTGFLKNVLGEISKFGDEDKYCCLILESMSFAAAVKSTLAIANNFLKNHNFKYILTYKFSQDALEFFFGFMRGKFGHNNNPNCLQFKYALKSILLHNSIKMSSGNCTLLSSNEDSLFEKKWKYKKLEEQENDDVDYFLLVAPNLT